MKDTNWRWVTITDALELLVKTLFQEEVACRVIPSHLVSPISEDQRRLLEKPVSQAEIKRDLLEMAPFEAPGVYGFHPEFYPHSWEIVGDTLGNFVGDFFKYGELPQGANDTLLALIPKVHHPETFYQLRPISLCKVGYKVITKKMTNRLNEIMMSVTSQNQCSFVLRR